MIEAILHSSRRVFAVPRENTAYPSEAKSIQIQRVYDANEYQIRLTITPAIEEEIWKIHGEIYHPTLWDLNGKIYLFIDEKLADKAALDEEEDGEFAFDCLQPGKYTLLFDISEAALHIDGLHIQWTPPELADFLLNQDNEANLASLLKKRLPHLTPELIEELKRRENDEMPCQPPHILEIGKVLESIFDAKASDDMQETQSADIKQNEQIEIAFQQFHEIALREEVEYQKKLILYKKETQKLLDFEKPGKSSLYLTKAKRTKIKRVYHVNEYQIRLTITRPTIDQEIWKIRGEIYHPTLWDLNGQIYLFLSDELAAQTALGEEEDGEFAFDCLQPGNYTLLFDMSEANLRLDGIRLEWSPPELADLLLNQNDDGNLMRLLEELRSNLTVELIEEFKRRVDDEMYRNASRALEIANLAEAVADFIPTPEAKALALWGKGNPLHLLVRNAEALACMQQAESIYAKQGRQIDAARLHINQIAVLQQMGEYQAALTLSQKARVICETLGLPAQQYLAHLEMNTGVTYQQLGELLAALEAYERAHILFATLPSRGQETRLAMIKINQANVLREMDRFAEAETLYLSARETFINSGYDQELARIDLNLGRLAYRRGQYQVALRYLEVARRGFAVIHNPCEVAFVDLYRSFVYRQLNMLQESMSLSIDAEKTFQQEAMLEPQALALINQALVHQRLGEYAQADAQFLKARHIWQEQYPSSRELALDLDHATLALNTGHLEEAQQLARQVEEQLDSVLWPSLTARLHLLFAQVAIATIPPKLTIAAQRTKQALVMARSHNLHELMIDADHLMAQILQQKGDFQAAWQAYLAAIERVEGLRALLAVDEFMLGFMEDKLPIYNDTVCLCHNMTTQATNRKSSPLAQMFYMLNLAVAALLPRLPAIEKGSAAFPASDDDYLRQELNTLREQWYWHHSKLEYRADIEKVSPEGPTLRGRHVSQADLYQQLHQLENQIAELMRRLQVRTTHAPLPSEVTGAIANSADSFLATVQAHLGSQEVLLQYYIVDEQVQALLVTRNSIQLVQDLTAVSRLEKNRNRWRRNSAELFFASHLGRVNKQLYRFYKALVAPIEAYLTDCKKIFLIIPPDFHDLPFSAFFDRQTYLANRFQLTYLSTPETLLRVGGKSLALGKTSVGSASSSKALVIGYSNKGDLPQTVNEACQVAELLTPHLPTTLLLENEATLSHFKSTASNSDLLHIASHAVFRADNPLFSWLRLANHDLTVAELYDQITFSQQPLVVLSCCETGLGRPRGGGLLGMARGLMVAGAGGLIVSLWKVTDDFVVELMNDFYTALVHDSASPEAALHYAKQQAIARGDHPYHWAGFIFIQG